MTPLHRSLLAGAVIAVVAVVTTTASSDRPVRTFLVTSAVCLVAVLSVASLARRRTRPGPRSSPR